MEILINHVKTKKEECFDKMLELAYKYKRDDEEYFGDSSYEVIARMASSENENKVEDIKEYLEYMMQYHNYLGQLDICECVLEFFNLEDNV
mgnify:CR=1 FL=1|jgi:hypothetical protein